MIGRHASSNKTFPILKNLCRWIYRVALGVLCACQVDNSKFSVAQLENYVITILTSPNCMRSDPVDNMRLA